MKSTIFERITNQFADAIETGAPDYIMPWNRAGKLLDCPTNAFTGRAYRGLNILTLWMDGESAGFETGKWATYRQWSQNGAQVRKGERGAPVFFWQKKEVADISSDEGDDRRRLGFFARAFTVFNADQIEGYAPEVDGDLEEPICRREFGSAYATTFAGSPPKLVLARRKKRSYDDDFHDRFIEIDVRHAGGAIKRHELTIGRGTEALYNSRRQCTVTYAPPGTL